MLKRRSLVAALFRDDIQFVTLSVREGSQLEAVTE